MRLFYRQLAVLAAILLAAMPLRAQFDQAGDNPASVRWSHFKTRNFHLIYPAGLDSLAWQYAVSLEQNSTPVSRTAGYAPNGMYRTQMPVILHAFNATSNGSVTWAPRRMDLYTVPDAYNPGPFPWIESLAIHESRHVAQMQFGYDGDHRIFSGLIGQLWTGAMSAVYPGPALLEGDAVTAETALSRYGRGRKADFLEYMMVSLDAGDWRNWYRWRYSSQKQYTPDHYKVGYMTVAGMRAVFDEPLFTEKYYGRIFRNKAWQLPLNVAGKTIREVSGEKPKEAFRDIEEAFLEEWREGIAERGPFMPMDTVTAIPRRYESVTGTTAAGGSMYAIVSGIAKTPYVARIGDDGSLVRVRPFAYSTSDLVWSESLGKLFWSESVTDTRWSLKKTSRIRYMDPSDARAHDLTTEGRLYNPAPEPHGERIAATDYPLEATSALVILDGRSGRELARYPAPDTLQVVESAWDGESVLTCAISETGFGIYKAGTVYEEVLPPQPVSIMQMRSNPKGGIWFVSDRTGVDELYSLSTDGVLMQLTSTRYGASSYVFEGDSLFFSALSPQARSVCRTAVSDLPVHEADFADIHSWGIANKLSAQEEALAWAEQTPMETMPEVKPYHKGTHLFHFHSWAPLYIDYDEITSMSLESVMSDAALGATAMFQNHLGSAYGSVGYGFHLASGQPHHSGHFKFNYSGWYPVISTTLDIGDDFASQYQLYLVRQTDGVSSYARGVRKASSVPLLTGSVKAYIPFNFSSGGWQRGIIPQVQYGFSNSMFATSIRGLKYLDIIGSEGNESIFGGLLPGQNVPMHRLMTSVRGYCILPTATAAVYPRLGIGAETGYTRRISLGDVFSPSAFFFLYGYVPGIIPQHGLKLTATYQQQFGSNVKFGENYISSYPRGMSYMSSYIAAVYPSQTKLTADYRMAVAPVDWTWLCPLAYIRNFEVTLHGDAGIYAGSRHRDLAGTGTLYSVGADVCAVLGNIAWIPYDTRVGVTWSFNGGSAYDAFKALGAPMKRNCISLTFSVDM